MPNLVKVTRFFMLLGFLFQAANARADTSLIAYRLAQIHEQQAHPEKSLMGTPVVPGDATVAEFRWILDSLKGSCLNPETTLADTLVETWGLLRQRGQSMPLLGVARELSQTAQSAFRRTGKKVNFRMTSRYWLKHNGPKSRKQPLTKDF